MRRVNGEEYCFANTFIKMDSEFYRSSIMPFNIASALLSGFLFPVLLFLIIWYGKKKNLFHSLAF